MIFLSSSEQQNLVYSLFLLLFLLSSLFFRKNFKFSQIIKYLTIWSIIAFIIIILYSYRFEFENFKNRIAGEINPNKAIISQDKIIINISADGHFYVNSKINNKPIKFMVDTGASDIVLSLEDAKKIGINIDNLIFNKIYNTANGKVFGASTQVKTLEISGIKFHDVRISVNSAKLDISLLGMSFLRQFNRYEFFQDKLILEL